ncbi:MAG TPA: thiamine phosphate synthase [Candidatus Micrarchaeota archaeon]|nr:thiamine phosphate synthase [Candidatus Micrarchaeota archaeon]
MKAKINGFYFITDANLSKNGVLQDAADAIKGGAGIIQLRDKKASPKELLETASALRKITAKAGVAFIVNDNVEAALESGADGVHLGQEDADISEAKMRMPGKIIGISVSTPIEAKDAEEKGADYLGVGPIFATSTKKDAAKPIGLVGLKEIRKAASLPIIAIGGITHENAKSAIQSGANGVCAISAAAGDGVEAKVRAFSGLFRK